MKVGKEQEEAPECLFSGSRAAATARVRQLTFPTTYPVLSEAGVRGQGGLGHMDVGQEDQLELQPGVGTGMVEEADILCLEERHRDSQPGRGLL